MNIRMRLKKENDEIVIYAKKFGTKYVKIYFISNTTECEQRYSIGIEDEKNDYTHFFGEVYRLSLQFFIFSTYDRIDKSIVIHVLNDIEEILSEQQKYIFATFSDLDPYECLSLMKIFLQDFKAREYISFEDMYKLNYYRIIKEGL